MSKREIELACGFATDRAKPWHSVRETASER
jgi:hypothetical protein